VTYTRSVALAPPSSFRARWAPRLALIGYVGLLATSVLAPGGRAGVAGAGFFDLRTETQRLEAPVHLSPSGESVELGIASRSGASGR